MDRYGAGHLLYSLSMQEVSPLRAQCHGLFLAPDTLTAVTQYAIVESWAQMDPFVRS
jgi:hypothetical protein